MAATLSQNYVTMSHDGSQGDREFVFACKGRPFSVLTAPNFPTPAVTMVDYNLIRDLKLRLTDMQCAKLSYGGQKLRILGRLSTTVQCISNGAPAGNMHFKAIVVQDLYQSFDTHSIAGKKLSEKLIGQPFEILSDDSTEPTKNKASPKMKVKKKKKAKDTKALKLSSDGDPECVPKSPPLSPSPSKSSPASHQGKWIQYNSDGCCYRYETESDEYDDNYTNISTIRQNEPLTPAPPDSMGVMASHFTVAQRRERRDEFKKSLMRRGHHTPDRLKHIPIPHGSSWCDADCLWQGEDNLPPECGYHPNFGRINNCSRECPGGWCQHTRQIRDRASN